MIPGHISRLLHFVDDSLMKDESFPDLEQFRSHSFPCCFCICSGMWCQTNIIEISERYQWIWFVLENIQAGSENNLLFQAFEQSLFVDNPTPGRVNQPDRLSQLLKRSSREIVLSLSRQRTMVGDEIADF